MQIKEIREMIRLVSQSDLSVFEMENDGFRIRMENNTVKTVAASAEQGVAVQQFAAETVLEEPLDVPVQVPQGTPVKAPLVGVFYTSPSPDQAAYVKVGDRVKKGDVLCIVEAMKVMNEITAEIDGTITAVLVENEALVEYGQDLFMIG
jgi:acetyl-CoA carboxylase biotin carboxyl carrier protein